MGDRGNIVVRDRDGSEVWLYSHWFGASMPAILQSALKRGRWDDGQYLARVIFQTLVGDDGELTGYGISAVMRDNEHAILVVDIAKKIVGVRSEKDIGARYVEEYPLAGYVELPASELVRIGDMTHLAVNRK